MLSIKPMVKELYYLEPSQRIAYYFSQKLNYCRDVWQGSQLHLIRSRHLEVFFKRDLKISQNSWKLGPATLSKKRLRPRNFAKFERTPFLQNTSDGSFCLAWEVKFQFLVTKRSLVKGTFLREMFLDRKLLWLISSHFRKFYILNFPRCKVVASLK